LSGADETGATRGPLRRVLRGLAGSLIGLVIALVCVELVLRVAPGVPEGIKAPVGLHDMRLLTEPDPDLYYGMMPDAEGKLLPTLDLGLYHVRTSAIHGGRLGFRGDHSAGEAPIVMLGDSFALGWGVEEEDTIEEVLSAEVGLDVANLGVSGYAPQQALLALEHHGLALSPRIVVWVLYANDPFDAAGFDGWVEGGKVARRLEPKSWFQMSYNRHSAAYKFYKCYAPFRSSRRVHFEGDGLEYLFVHYWQRELDLENEDVARGFVRTKEALDRLAELAAQHDFVPVVCTVPFKEQVYWEDYLPLAHAAGRDVAPREELDRPLEELAGHARALGITTLEAEPYLRAARAEQIYLVHDPHFTPAGNRVVGEALARLLRDEGLLEPLGSE
jgi:hypothetical protein